MLTTYSVYFVDVFSTKKADSLLYIVLSMQDSANIYLHSKHLSSKSPSACEILQENIEKMIEEEIVSPFCKEVETELRLLVHKQVKF